MAAKRPRHNAWFIALVVFNVITLLALFVISGLSMIGNQFGLFLTTQTEQWDARDLDITPTRETFLAVWGVVHVWQAVWMVYSVVSLFRENPLDNEEPLYASPYLLPPLLFGGYSLGNGCTVLGCFLFDRSRLEASLAAVALSAAFLVLSTVVAHRTLPRADGNVEELIRQGRGFEVWLVRGFVHNGLGIYAAWISFLALLHLAAVLAHSRVLGSDDVSGAALASTTVLGILSLAVVVLAVIDVVRLDAYSRYTFTPYLVLVAALVGSLVRNWDPGASNSVFTAVLCGVSGAAFLVKLAVSITRHVHDRKGRRGRS